MALVYLDGSSLLIAKDRAAAYKQEQAAKEAETPPTQPPGQPSAGGAVPTPGTVPGTAPGTAPIPAVPKTRFYGTVSLDPIKAKLDFATIMDEVIQAFTSRPDAKVQISFDIQAERAGGFDEALQRTIKENCNVLKFSSAEFDND